jgi:hypothetical protein
MLPWAELASWAALRVHQAQAATGPTASLDQLEQVVEVAAAVLVVQAAAQA